MENWPVNKSQKYCYILLLLLLLVVQE